MTWSTIYLPTVLPSEATFHACASIGTKSVADGKDSFRDCSTVRYWIACAGEPIDATSAAGTANRTHSTIEFLTLRRDLLVRTRSRRRQVHSRRWLRWDHY